MISSLFDIFNSVCLECGCLCYIHSLPGTKIFPKLLLFPLFSDVIYGIVFGVSYVSLHVLIIYQ